MAIKSTGDLLEAAALPTSLSEVMPDTIEGWLRRLGRLRTNRNARQWCEATAHQAPHKPLLILSILDRIEAGFVTSSNIALDHELAETFARYWACLPQRLAPGRIALPFFHLQGDGFWRLEPRPGKEPELNSLGSVSSVTQLAELVQHARMDEDLYHLCTIPEARDRMRRVILERYFGPAVRERIDIERTLNRQIIDYSRALLGRSRLSLVSENPDGEAYGPKVRTLGFRRAVVSAYDRRCALCALRIITDDGRSAVEATQISPESAGGKEQVTNGLALCRLCSWAFDQGLLALDSDYTILTSKLLTLADNLPGHLYSLTARPMVFPLEQQHRPGRAALQWHRREVFRSAETGGK